MSEGEEGEPLVGSGQPQRDVNLEKKAEQNQTNMTKEKQGTIQHPRIA